MQIRKDLLILTAAVYVAVVLAAFTVLAILGVL